VSLDRSARSTAVIHPAPATEPLSEDYAIEVNGAPVPAVRPGTRAISRLVSCET